MANFVSPRASLLGMALETRLRIYSYLFEDAEVRIHLPKETLRTSLTTSEYYNGATIITHNFPTSITYVSRALYADAGSVLYSKAILRVCSMSSRPIDLGALRIPARLRTLCQTLAIDNDILDHSPSNLSTLPSLKTLSMERCCVRLNSNIYDSSQPLSYMTSDELLVKAVSASFIFPHKEIASGIDILFKIIFDDRSFSETEKATLSIAKGTLTREGVLDDYVGVLDDCRLCEQDGAGPRFHGDYRYD